MSRHTTLLVTLCIFVSSMSPLHASPEQQGLRSWITPKSLFLTATVASAACCLLKNPYDLRTTFFTHLIPHRNWKTWIAPLSLWGIGGLATYWYWRRGKQKFGSHNKLRYASLYQYIDELPRNSSIDTTTFLNGHQFTKNLISDYNNAPQADKASIQEILYHTLRSILSRADYCLGYYSGCYLERASFATSPYEDFLRNTLGLMRILNHEKAFSSALHILLTQHKKDIVSQISQLLDSLFTDMSQQKANLGYLVKAFDNQTNSFYVFLEACDKACEQSKLLEAYNQKVSALKAKYWSKFGHAYRRNR